MFGGGSPPRRKVVAHERVASHGRRRRVVLQREAIAQRRLVVDRRKVAVTQRVVAVQSVSAEEGCLRKERKGRNGGGGWYIYTPTVLAPSNFRDEPRSFRRRAKVRSIGGKLRSVMRAEG